MLFLGVDTQDAVEDALAYVERVRLTFPNGLDEDGEITIAYGVVGLPVTFFIGADGVVQTPMGGRDRRVSAAALGRRTGIRRAVARRSPLCANRALAV